MRNKKVLFFCVALVLLAFVAGVAFAATNTDGVLWGVIEGKSPRLGREQNTNWYLEVWNSNNYPVKLHVTGVTGSGEKKFAAGETKHFVAGPSARIYGVEEIR